MADPVDDLVAEAPFIFRGRIDAFGRATTTAVQTTDRSAVVRVERVIRAPAAFGRLAGVSITVELTSTEGLQPGTSLIIFARPRLFADSLVVEEIGRQHLDAATGESGGVHDAVARHAAQALRDRLATADAVVTGRVSHVRPSLVAAATPGMNAPHSEHDPDWHEAVIEIDSVIRGNVSPGPISVLYPASIDVAWYQSPKYHAGQEGVWALHSEGVPETAAQVVGRAFTTLDLRDFHPREAEPRLRAMIERGSA